MATKQGFKRDSAAVAQILKSDPGVGAALDEIAEQMAKRSGGTVKSYITDRQVRAVVVDAEDQAINGAATKAAGEVAGFSSRREWRKWFRENRPDAHDRAHATRGGYEKLPERSGGKR